MSSQRDKNTSSRANGEREPITKIITVKSSGDVSDTSNSKNISTDVEKAIDGGISRPHPAEQTRQQYELPFPAESGINCKSSVLNLSEYRQQRPSMMDISFPIALRRKRMFYLDRDNTSFTIENK